MRKFDQTLFPDTQELVVNHLNKPQFSSFFSLLKLIFFKQSSHKKNIVTFHAKSIHSFQSTTYLVRVAWTFLVTLSSWFYLRLLAMGGAVAILSIVNSSKLIVVGLKTIFLALFYGEVR